MPSGWKELLGLAGWRSVLRDDILVELQVLRHNLLFAELLAHDDGSRASSSFWSDPLVFAAEKGNGGYVVTELQAAE